MTTTYEDYITARFSKPVIKWWVVLESGMWMRHEATMRGRWGYEVTCSCGWKTATGGALKSYMQKVVAQHKSNHHSGWSK
jgi:hypothetical protein